MGEPAHKIVTENQTVIAKMLEIFPLDFTHTIITGKDIVEHYIEQYEKDSASRWRNL